MTEKDIKKLNRYQLLELLVIQSEQVKDLQDQIEQMQKRLDAREIQMSVVGSIAEASMQLGGIFSAAQNTADIYLDAVKARVAQIEENARREAEQILQEARNQAEQIRKEAQMGQNLNITSGTDQQGTDEL